jgi:hypothetical protein
VVDEELTSMGENESKVTLELSAVAKNAAIQEFASFSKEQQLIVLRLVRMEFSPIGVLSLIDQ